MKYFREIKPEDQLMEGDLAFHDDDPVVKAHRVRIEKFELVKSLDEIEQLLKK